jgi:hypothetical protein
MKFRALSNQMVTQVYDDPGLPFEMVVYSLNNPTTQLVEAA